MGGISAGHWAILEAHSLCGPTSEAPGTDKDAARCAIDLVLGLFPKTHHGTAGAARPGMNGELLRPTLHWPLPSLVSVANKGMVTGGDRPDSR